MFEGKKDYKGLGSKLLILANNMLNAQRDNDEITERADILFNHPDNERREKQSNQTGNNNNNNNKSNQHRKNVKRLQLKEPNPLDKINISVDKFKTKAQDAKKNLLNFPDKVINSNDISREKATDIIESMIKKTPAVTYNLIRMSKGKFSAKNLEMAYKSKYLNTQYALQNKIYKNVYEIQDEIIREKLKAKIIQELGYNKLNETDGILFDYNTSVSQGLAKSDDIINLLQKKDIKTPLLEGKMINTTLRFTKNDYANAIGRADILKVKRLNDGSIDLYVCDLYNFNPNEKNFQIAGPYNLEKEGFLKPYFDIYHVNIPKTTADVILGLKFM